jgi:hypothetical protein
MMRGSPGRRLRLAFPFVATVLFVSLRYASWLRLSAIDLSWNYVVTQGLTHGFAWRLWYLAHYVLNVFWFIALIFVLFLVLGGYVGEYLNRVPSLKGYGINLAGSLVGMALFSALALLNSSPTIWLLVGFAALVPFFLRQRTALVLFAFIIAATAVPQPNSLWSPYHRIDFKPLPGPTGWPRVSAYTLISDHSWYQFVVDLSPEFLRLYPQAEPNQHLVPYYELPYQLTPNAKNVLILGAGTGNDAAGALRHGAEHVDAVEIDPEILRLGRQYHPERPYISPRVTTYADDARAFLKKTKKKYDLVVFGYLDSSILLSSFSSLRLDNYVYTLESFQDAKRS